MFCNGFGYGRFGGNGYGYGGAGFMMMIPMLIILLLVIYFVYKAISRKDINLSANRTSSNAIDILNERFAKGEISEEEYSARKKQLLK
ncbi:SHOCT domain-containing protein [Clostridium sp. 'White wine YQ']|uniref:SHOCT domain-containing protein n=1 Tax=Clostridium sp. 'White wine YQ' TaxID=3027474 RepID=UPI0023653594|nr:SHOCT domain-containing protein [Clostridium sp. 'White wine YQ']MDD7793512.1 SHOCT domain-containing protein [Clostridium sp. 'White wine YQ']